MARAANVGEFSKRIGWPLRSVLELITSTAARAVGMAEEVGSLTPGKRADVLVIEPNTLLTQPMTDPLATLVFYTGNSDIKTVLVNGQVRKRDGILQGVDLASIQSKAKQALTRIKQRYTQLPREQFDHAWARVF